MLLSLVSLAAAHPASTPHVHADSLGLLVMAAWTAVAALWWRRAVA